MNGEHGEDWNAVEKMREYNKQVPQAWRNQAEWITVYLLEQVVAELREIRRMITDQPGLPVSSPEAIVEFADRSLSKSAAKKPAAKRKPKSSAKAKA